MVLAACGGNGTSGSDGITTTASSAAEPESIPMTDPVLTTYDVGGFYTLEVPKDIESKEASFSDAISVNSPDGTWFMRFNSKEGGTAEYDAEKQLNQNEDTFSLITVGDQEGFWVYNTMRGEVFIYFPFGLVQLGDDLQSSAKAHAAYLDDPIVQNLQFYSFSLPEGETGTYERDGLKVTSQWGKYGFVIRFEPK